MTQNHDYNVPSKGAADWHVPLNDNFQRLDRDVEVRDVDSNRSNYIPIDGAKYLATDTGNVYIGNGSDWDHLGDIVPEMTGDGTLVAAPGEVQSALDAAGQWETVRLQAGQTYSIDSTIDVSQYTVLDCNWATLEPASDVPLIDMGMNSVVRNAVVNLRAYSGYSSNVVQWIAEGDDYFGPHNPAYLHNLRIKGNIGEGTALYFSQRGNNGHFISLQQANNISCDGIGKFIEFDGQGSPGHMNSMQITNCSVESMEYLIDMHGVGDMVANYFGNFHVQPHDGSRYGWKILAEDPNSMAIHNNLLVGENWDQNIYSDYEFETRENGGIAVRNHMLTLNGAEDSSTVNCHHSSNSVVHWHRLLDGVGVS